MPVLFDIQGVQSRAHGERGIARYLNELASALDRDHSDLVSRFVLNRELPVPPNIGSLVRADKLGFVDRVHPERRTIYHVGSPVELEVPIDGLWPPQVRRLRFVVTVYDLIPLLFPEIYLREPWQRRRYEARLELIRRADRVLAISETTAADVIEHLGVAPERVVVVGTGVSERFCPAESRSSATSAARRDMPWLEPDFLLYTGGIEPRKNIDRLLRAYAGLPAETRSRHQLLVVCRVASVDRVRLEEELRELGIADRVRFPGFVPDDQLVRLYQAAGLVVFPSLYEGFGLPVAEALACGAAVIASETPALVELVDDPSARFDPRDTRAMSSTMERFLGSEQSLERLRVKGLDTRFSWPVVAERTAGAYEDVLELPGRRRPRRPRIAWVSPLPPQRTGIADESYRVLRVLVERCEIDAYVDGPNADQVQAPQGVEVKKVRRFEIAERAHGGYERVFYCLGNSEYHTGALSLLGRRPGVVVAHDVRLNGLYSWRAHERPDLDPRPLKEILHSMYPGRLPEELGADGWIGIEDADRFGIFMAREAIASSARFLVHSRHAAELARLEAPPGEERKVDVIPFGVVSPDKLEPAAPDEPPVVATFGLVGPPKQVVKIVEAFPQVLARGAAKLAVVGPHTGAGERRQLDARAHELRITGHFQQTGYVEEPKLKEWLARTTIAVQLRATSNGETSAAVAKCLAAGVPTIVTDIGSAAELPDEAALKVDRDIAPEALAEVIADLLADSKRRAEMAAAGVDWARSHSHERLAQALYAEVVRG